MFNFFKHGWNRLRWVHLEATNIPLNKSKKGLVARYFTIRNYWVSCATCTILTSQTHATLYQRCRVHKVKEIKIDLSKKLFSILLSIMGPSNYNYINSICVNDNCKQWCEKYARSMPPLIKIKGNCCLISLLSTQKNTKECTQNSDCPFNGPSSSKAYN